MEKINVAEILKDCPSGMELDCVMYENVYFDKINDDKKSYYPIFCYITDEKGNRSSISFTKNGCESIRYGAKCVIFPKGKTTWEGFVPPRKFKDGDIVTCTNDACTYTAIFKEMIDKGAFCHYGVPVDNKFRCRVNDWSDFNETCRLATEEEKQRLFDAIKAYGYKWNAETKTLEKLIEPNFKVGDIIKDKCNLKWKVTNENGHYYEVTLVLTDTSKLIEIKAQDDYELVPKKFDIDSLVPFESRVLVRSSMDGLWKPAVFGFRNGYNDNAFYIVGGNCWKQCIPYLNNEHLCGTTDDCDDFYKTWE